jgi:hypothetical protein
VVEHDLQVIVVGLLALVEPHLFSHQAPLDQSSRFGLGVGRRDGVEECEVG